MVAVPYQAQQGMMMGAAWPATSASVALALSIISSISIICGGCLLAIVALILAYNARSVVRQYPGHPDTGSTTAAIVISWIVIGLSAAFIVLYMLFFVLIVNV